MDYDDHVDTITLGFRALFALKKSWTEAVSGSFSTEIRTKGSSVQDASGLQRVRDYI